MGVINVFINKLFQGKFMYSIYSGDKNVPSRLKAQQIIAEETKELNGENSNHGYCN